MNIVQNYDSYINISSKYCRMSVRNYLASYELCGFLLESYAMLEIREQRNK
jgi:hypothetical protein